MRCFITGVDGFAGSRLMQRLLDQGVSVKALVPTGTRASELEAQGVEAEVGLPEGLGDSFRDVVRGVDVVFHCDAFLDPRGPADAFHEVNVVGTRRVLDAAIGAGICRFVHLSSQSVVWGGQAMLGSEDDLPYPEQFTDPYSASRADAERQVLVTARAGRIEAVAIRPGWTWGPGDTVVLPILVRQAAKGVIPLVGRGEFRTATTYIDHLVDAMISAATATNIAGKVYFVSDPLEVTHRRFIDLQLGAVGIVPQYRHIPAMVAKAAAAVAEAAAPWMGLQLPLVRLITGMTGCDIIHNTTKAQQDLGFSPRISLDEGLDRLRAWSIEIGGPSVIAGFAQFPSEQEDDQ